MSTDRSLEIKGVSKRYGDTVALQDLGLEVRAGELFGFVGRNGAGKTTAMRIVLGVLAPDAGEVRWDGVPLDFAARRRSPKCDPRSRPKTENVSQSDNGASAIHATNHATTDTPTVSLRGGWIRRPRLR